MKKVLAALVAALFTLGTGASFAADITSAQPSVASKKKVKKAKKATAAKKEEAKK